MTYSAIERGVVLPLTILALAYAVLFFAGQAGSLGPLDFATYQWIIVGLWVAAPVVGGLVSHALSDRLITLTAALLAVVLGLAVAFFLLTAAGTASSCARGAVGSVAAYSLGCLGDGAVVGIGVGAGEVVTARLARRGLWLPAVLLGGGLSFLASAAAYLFYYSFVTCL